MRDLTLREIFHSLQIYTFVVLFISRSVGGACDYRKIKSALNTIKGYTSTEMTDDSIYSLIPHIPDKNNEGFVSEFCDKLSDVENTLKTLRADECSGAETINVQLSKIAGYDYMCNTGRGGYGKYSKCITEMTQKLQKKCPTKHDRLINLASSAIYAEEAKHSALCLAIDKYLQCSHSTISEGCGGEQAGNWHRSYMKSVYSHLVSLTTLKCSFGGTSGPFNNNVTTIAIFVGVGVLVLLLLFCFCWCCRAGVCACCKEEDDDDIKYHMPDNNDNEKDHVTMTGVNSVV